MVEYSVKSLALYDMCNHLWFYNAKFRCFLDVLLAKKYSATFHSLNKHRISLDEIVSVIVFKINDPPPAPTHTHKTILFIYCVIFALYGDLVFYLFSCIEKFWHPLLRGLLQRSVIWTLSIHPSTSTFQTQGCEVTDHNRSPVCHRAGFVSSDK